MKIRVTHNLDREVLENYLTFVFWMNKIPGMTKGEALEHIRSSLKYNGSEHLIYIWDGEEKEDRSKAFEQFHPIAKKLVAKFY